MMAFNGGCHCGNIAYILRWPTGETPLLRRCDCSFCTRHGAAYTSHPEASLLVTVKDPGAFSEYQFSTRTARFRFCARCGVLTFVTALIDGQEHAVVNVSTVNNFLPTTDLAPKHFEGETLQQRLDRRRRTWISNVNMTIAGSSNQSPQTRL